MLLERYRDAIADFELVAGEDVANRGIAHFNIARCYSLLGEPESAIHHLESAVASGFRIFEIHADLENIAEEPNFRIFMDMVLEASDLIRSGEFELADQLFTEWLYNNPYHVIAAWALMSRGDCRMRLGRHDQAISDFEAAAEMDDGFRSEAYYNCACACAVTGRPEKALDYLEGAVEAGFNDFDLMKSDPDLEIIQTEPRFRALGWTW
jgi:tetratricopeptide (TPR) repeat protein